MNNKQKTNFKVLAASLFISSIIIGLNSPKTLTISSADSDIISDDTQPDSGTNTTTASANMLDVNNSVITEARVQKLQGENQNIKATFAQLPNIKEKIFAVLVDERAGGVIQSKFVDEDNNVEFTNIYNYISIPGIHLYKQSPTDPDFLIRPENFIAGTSYLMPYIKKIENSGLATARKADGTEFEADVPKLRLDSTSDPQIYSLRVPENFYDKVRPLVKTPSSEFCTAVVISHSDDNYDKDPIEIKQWVATNYNEEENMFRFEFLIPKEAKYLQIHLYRNGLFKDYFFCKFYIDLNEFKPT